MPDKKRAKTIQSVSPAARRLAEELGIDLDSLKGSGSQGRILVADVEQAESMAGKNLSAMTGSGYRRKVTLADKQGAFQTVKIRHLLARKMEEAWKEIPHFYVTVAVDMTDVVRIRHDYEATVNDFVVAATARALVQHPWVNATWNGEQGIELPEVNIAMAAATDRGLYYPVIHNCHQLSLKKISEKARFLAEKSDGPVELSEQETAGATFTITNMGMFGVESFGAIITPPQAAVLSIGSVKGEVVVDDQGEPDVALMMRLTLSADHRVLDGADAAEFLDTVKCYLEAPVMLVND